MKTPIIIVSESNNYIGWLQLIDDGSLSAVVQTQTNHVHLLLLQAQPSCQLVEEPHWPFFFFKFQMALTLFKAKGSKLRGVQLQCAGVVVVHRL